MYFYIPIKPGILTHFATSVSSPEALAGGVN